MDTLLTAARLRELRTYDPATGLFSFARQGGGHFAGAPCGKTTSQGYTRIVVDGGKYMAHRLAWLWMTGEWPEDQIDHINGDRSDNRWPNLRAATASINVQNIHAPKSNNKTSGVLGVRPCGARFEANIGHNYRRIYLGRFDTADEAHAAYLTAKRRLHPGNTL